MSKITMSWNDRFTMIDHYKPTDEQIVNAFGLTMDELETARSLRAAGTFSTNAKLDVAKYGNVFAGMSGTAVGIPVTSQNGVPISVQALPGSTNKVGTATTHARPETATKKVKIPQKRGRKGDKISNALRAVPTTQVPVDQFMKQHGVSLAVLRQSKRFIAALPVEVQREIGKINVRQDKASKVLVIWREAE